MNLNLTSPLEVKIPFLYEMWNWVGDTSILPTKWGELLKKHDLQSGTETFKGLNREVLNARFVRNEKFDPYGFFFITTRSEVVSGVLVWPIDRNSCELVAAAALPGHRDREVAHAAIGLSLNYAISKGFQRVFYNEHE